MASTPIPTIDAPWLWQLLEFVYHRDPVDYRASYIDMVFERDEQIKKLRFFAPHDLEISRGMPTSFGM